MSELPREKKTKIVNEMYRYSDDSDLVIKSRNDVLFYVNISTLMGHSTVFQNLLSSIEKNSEILYKIAAFAPPGPPPEEEKPKVRSVVEPEGKAEEKTASVVGPEGKAEKKAEEAKVTELEAKVQENAVSEQEIGELLEAAREQLEKTAWRDFVNTGTGEALKFAIGKFVEKISTKLLKEGSKFVDPWEEGPTKQGGGGAHKVEASPQKRGDFKKGGRVKRSTGVATHGFGKEIR